MKILTKLIVLIAIILANGQNSYSQVNGEQRGLYIDDFISTIQATGSTFGDIIPAQSILGTSQEDDILKYCMENHITYITLYGLRQIFTGNSKNYKIDLLKDFICKAKSEYCIQYVGATVGGFLTADNFDDPNNNLYRMPSEPYIFDSIFHGTVYYDSLRFIEDSIIDSYEDDKFYVAEAVKLALRLLDIQRPSSSCANSSNYLVDILVTEWEFWQTPTGNFPYSRTGANNDYMELIDKLDGIRNNHSVNYPFSPPYIESYINWLRDGDDINGLINGPCRIADFIDGNDNLGNRRVDRIQATYYNRTGPGNIYNNQNRLYANRLLDFDKSNNDLNPPSTTLFNIGTVRCDYDDDPSNPGNPDPDDPNPMISSNNKTDYHPLFSAQSTSLGDPIGSNFLGDWLVSSSDINIFTAERDFHDEFINDLWANVHSNSDGNLIKPGACQWFSQSRMVKPLDHPITFLGFTTSCPSGGTA